jgi:hypothetical protein
MRGGAGKSIPPVFFLIYSLGNTYMCLSRCLSLFHEIHRDNSLFSLAAISPNRSEPRTSLSYSPFLFLIGPGKRFIVDNGVLHFTILITFYVPVERLNRLPNNGGGFFSALF